MFQEYFPIFDWPTDYIFNYVASEHIFIIQQGFNANIYRPQCLIRTLGVQNMLLTMKVTSSLLFFGLL